MEMDAFDLKNMGAAILNKSRNCAVNDAIAKPVDIQYVPRKYGSTSKCTGQNATVVVNLDGSALTTWVADSTGTGK